MNKNLFVIILLLPGLCFAKPVLDIHTWKTTAGTPVYFVPSTSAPMIDVALVFNAGSANDGKKFGLANLTNAMFAESTANWNTTEIAERFARVGASFANTTTKSMAMLNLRSLTDPEKLAYALTTFTQVVAGAEFPKTNLDRVKQQIIVTIRGQQQDPGTIASNLLVNQIFGDSSYGQDPLGTVTSVGNISRDEVRNFYKTYYVAHNAFVAIVGNVTVAQAKNMAESIISQLPTGKAIVRSAIPDNTQATLSHIDFPSTQNHIRMGEITIGRENPDYFALAVGNYILGNGFTSRLFQQVREKRGLSYYVGSSLIALPTKSLFVIALQTKNSSTAKAINITQDTLNKFIKQGPTNIEVENAKRSIIGSFPLLFDSNTGILSCIVTLAFFNLPLNYYDNYRAKIQAVTPAQIKTVFQKYIILNNLKIVSVGGK